MPKRDDDNTRRADAGRLIPHPVVAEALEGRRLLSANLNGATLKVIGTQDDDTIVIALNGADPTKLDVTLNGELRTFAIAAIRKPVKINTLGGDDVVQVTGAVTLPLLINGSKGDDEIFSGAGIDRIIGGKGDDELEGGLGADVVLGGPGQDEFHSTDAESELADFDPVDDGDGVIITLAEAPVPVQAAITTLLAGDPTGKIIRELDEGATVFELEWEAGLGRSAKITSDGTVVELEAEIDPATLPAAVTAAIVARYPKGEITEAETLDVPGQPQLFEVEVTLKRVFRELVVTPAGEILEDEIEGRVGG